MLFRSVGAEIHHIEVRLDFPAPWRPVPFFLVEFITLERGPDYLAFDDRFGSVDSSQRDLGLISHAVTGIYG